MTDTTRRGRPAKAGWLHWRRNPRTGACQWFTQLTLPDGARPLVELDPSIPEHDREAAKACALEVSEQARGSAAVSARNLETVAEYAKRWLDARTERGLASVSDDRGRLSTHVLPELGSRDVRTVGRDALEGLVEKLDAKVRAGAIAWKTAIHSWGLVTKMFADASGAKRRDLRVRADNPAAGVHGPDRGARRAKVYLYPAEFAQLVAHPDVPLRWRRMFALTTYLYARAGEVNALTWADVDLERGVVHIHRSTSRRTGESKSTKTGGTRRVPIEPALMPLLTAMHAEAEGVGRVSPVNATDKKTSRQLQRCLRLAGLTRADLYADDATRKPLTFHDLRSTGLTWCAVRGDDPLRIKQRAGHAAFTTTEVYIREAENLRETNFGEPFPELPEDLMTSERTSEHAAPGILQRVLQRCETQSENTSENEGLQWRRRESKTVPSVQKGTGNPDKTDLPDRNTSRAVAEFDATQRPVAEQASRVRVTSGEGTTPDPLAATLRAGLEAVVREAIKAELARRGAKPRG